MDFLCLGYCNIIQYIEKKMLEDNIVNEKEVKELYEDLLINMYEFIGNNIEHFGIIVSGDIKC